MGFLESALLPAEVKPDVDSRLITADELDRCRSRVIAVMTTRRRRSRLWTLLPLPPPLSFALYCALASPLFLLVVVFTYQRLVSSSSSSSLLSAALSAALPSLSFFQPSIPQHPFTPLTSCSPIARQRSHGQQDSNSTITLHVSQSASSSSSPAPSGSASSPFPSIQQALDALAVLRISHPSAAVTILLDSGFYHLPQPLVLNASHSGDEAAPVSITSLHPSAPASLSGGVDIPHSCLQQLDSIPASLQSRLPAASRPLVLAVHLPSCLSLPLPLPPLLSFGFSQPVLPSHPLLFLDHVPLHLARFPNRGEDWLRTGKVLSEGSVIRSRDFSKRPFTFELTDEVRRRVETWKGKAGAGVTEADSVWMFGYWRWDWAEQSVQVAAVRDGAVTSRQSSHYGVVPRARFFFYNVLEELDAAGEYVIDDDGWLLFLPPHRLVTEEMRAEGRRAEQRLGLSSSASVSALPASQLQLALSPHPVVSFSSAHHISLHHLTVELTRGSGIRILDSHHLSLSHLTIRRIGNVGIMCGDGAPVQHQYTADPAPPPAAQLDADVVVGDMGQSIFHRNFIDTLWDRRCGSCLVVSECLLHTLGAGGVIMGGGDRLSLSPGRNRVVNNHIHSFSLLWSTYRPAVWLDGVGNELRHNVISRGPHVAVLLNGNNHLVESNDISAVCEETADVGVIYTGRDWTQRGHVLRYNFIHHISAVVPLLPSSSSSSSANSSSAAFLTVGTDASAVYFDDLSSGSTVSHNIFYRVHRGVLIGGGSHHVVSHNLFLQVETPLQLDARAMNSHRALVGNDSALHRRFAATPVSSPQWRRQYPGLDSLQQHRPELPSANVVQYNAAIDCGPLFISNEVVDRPVQLLQTGREAAAGNESSGSVLVRLRVDGVNISFVRSDDERLSIAARLYGRDSVSGGRAGGGAVQGADGGQDDREGHTHICYDRCLQYSWMTAKDVWVEYDAMQSLSGWRLDRLPVETMGACCMKDEEDAGG